MNKYEKFWNWFFIITSILALILTPLFMYVVYINSITGDPDVSVSVGYWVGFIFIWFPIGGIIYSYSRKLIHKDLKYLPLMILAILSLVVIVLLIAVGMSIK